MRVLVDTAIWIDHLRSTDARLVSLLSEACVVTHDHIIGEVAMGSLKNRRLILDALLDLPRAPLAEEGEVRSLVELASCSHEASDTRMRISLRRFCFTAHYRSGRRMAASPQLVASWG